MKENAEAAPVSSLPAAQEQEKSGSASMIPNAENLTSATTNKSIYYYLDDDGKKLHRAREEDRRKRSITVFRYTYSKTFGLRVRKIREIQFHGWDDLKDLPSDFKRSPGYVLKATGPKSYLLTSPAITPK